MHNSEPSVGAFRNAKSSLRDAPAVLYYQGRIRENGLLLSEYPPGVKPTAYTFPRRNRLIAAWSEELQMIAAGKGSGARITAAFAEQYGRTVTWHTG